MGMCYLLPTTDRRYVVRYGPGRTAGTNVPDTADNHYGTGRFFLLAQVDERWQYLSESLASVKDDADEIAVKAAQLAGVESLAPYTDLNIIGMYAEAFGLDPDRVYDSTSFDTVAEFTIMWSMQNAYRKRFEHYSKALTPPKV